MKEEYELLLEGLDMKEKCTVSHYGGIMQANHYYYYYYYLYH
jgi:hypothetical protein